MKPAPFKYLAPGDTPEALELLAEYGYDAKLLAGGQSLIPTMNFRLAQPAVLIDLNGIEELSYLRPADDGGLIIGAMTRQRTVERSELVAQRAPLLHDTMPFIAHPQIRNRGTVGGSLAHADPAAELPAVMTALSAQFVLVNRNGERTVSAEEFFAGMFTTLMEPDELLREIRIPPQPSGSGWAFREIARRHGDYAMAGVAAAVSIDQQGICRDAHIVLFSVGDTPVPAREAVEGLVGQQPSADVITACAQAAAQRDIEPGDDIHASAAYRRHLAAVLCEDALQQAFQRAQGHS